MNVPFCLDGFSWVLDPWVRDQRRRARNRRKAAARRRR